MPNPSPTPRQHFNSRPSARGDARWLYTQPSFSRHFNSRPSARGDIKASIKRFGMDISIHAPPRGATEATRGRTSRRRFQFTPLREGRRARRKARKSSRTFQFTPLREGRRWLYTQPSFSRHFNSRPSARGDLSAAAFSDSRKQISIHAPPRGATLTVSAACSPFLFQFTPLREGRHEVPAESHRVREFQFTPLREGRPDCQRIQPILPFISIHAPPRGATLFVLCPCVDCLISIHAPPRGATRRAAEAPARQTFQFTPLREGRPRQMGTFTTTSAFQFTPLREGRQQKICNFCKSFVQPLQISMA